MKFTLIGDSCNINDKGKTCCSSNNKIDKVDSLKEHWDKTYSNNTEEKLSWYEKNLEPTLKLISKTGLNKSATILNVGSGCTTLIDELLNIGYTELIATDISKVALNKLESRLKTSSVKFVVDDLTNPQNLTKLTTVDLWIDRAVLHFFTEKKDQETYFELLKSKLKKNGFVLLAEYNLNGVPRCSGLPVHLYSKDMLMDKLGTDFELIESFNHKYISPLGDEKPYIYALFKKIV